MNLIVLAAGRGSRFKDGGSDIPKPLVPFNGHPLIWWSTSSALKSNLFKYIRTVLLREHDVSHQISASVLRLFPSTDLVYLDAVTSGAAETAYHAALTVNNCDPIAFLDCDLAFELKDRDQVVTAFDEGAKAVLCVFNSSKPVYSYCIINDGKVVDTVEKVVSSDLAIAGLYIFASKDIYIKYYEKYMTICNYSELFMSGLVGLMARSGELVRTVELEHHVSLGTPDEVREASRLAPNFLNVLL